MGQSDMPHQKPVKMYCGKCEDIYNPKASRHATIDGAYFGTSFHSIIFQVYPALIPEKSRSRHVPRVFGFKVHAAAALARWQDGIRIEQKRRLRESGVEAVKFVEDVEEGDEEEGMADDFGEEDIEEEPVEEALESRSQQRFEGARNLAPAPKQEDDEEEEVEVEEEAAMMDEIEEDDGHGRSGGHQNHQNHHHHHHHHHHPHPGHRPQHQSPAPPLSQTGNGNNNGLLLDDVMQELKH